VQPATPVLHRGTLRHSRGFTLVCSLKVTHWAGLNGPFGAGQPRVFGARQTPPRARCRRPRRSSCPVARGSPWVLRNGLVALFRSGGARCGSAVRKECYGRHSL
jgi:hypothetical protein